MRPLLAILMSLAAGTAMFATMSGEAHAAVAGCQPEKAAEKFPELAGLTIKLGADPSTPPYATIDDKDQNKLVGSDIDLAAAVFDCLGLKHEVSKGSWPGLFPAVVSGQIDLMLYLYYTPKRVAQGDFVVYMKSGSGAIVQAGNPKNIRAEADLCGKTVAAGLGTVEEKQLQALGEKCVAAGKSTINVMTSTDVPAGFRLVGSGRADAMISDLPLINMMVKKNPETYAVGYSVVSDYEIGAAFKKGSPLAAAFQQGLAAIQAAGLQKEIFAKYGIDPALEIPAMLKTK
ncbi:MAG TPA: ABC transporter substrate-binding protein [Ensifer sp.]|nr:ABC transporter substrate-binding protein [Ensifer sp.]